MKKIFKIILCLGVIAFALSACKTTKTLSTVDSGVRLKGEDLLEVVVGNTPVFDSFSSRLKMMLPSGKGEMTLNGYLKMQHDELIQISLLVPILRTEAVRVEFSPNRVLVIDRIHKRYADVPVDQLYELFGTDVNFHTLQALFTNNFFLPGKTNLKRRDYAAFKASLLNEDHALLVKDEGKMEYSFVASRITNRLVSSTIGIPSASYSLSFTYDQFVKAGDTTFPSDIRMVWKEPRKASRVSMELSRIEVNVPKIAPTDAPSKYQPIALSDILDKIKGD